ncbi:glycosyltransferase [Dactylosporangium sp. McL0621]|uniref:glycosyltransferase n=1 Tax=Dactylosporangium sp. McL0621 TaxID=3415678 RepID=UPI003CEBD7C6
MSQPAPVLSIITVTHNSREVLLKGLAALRTGTEVPAEMIVVDNGSTDNTAAAVRHAFRAVALIRRDEPLPAPVALNLGAARARAPWLLFLDPGLQPIDDTVRTLVEYAGSHPDDRLYTGRTLRERVSPGRAPLTARLAPVLARLPLPARDRVEAGRSPLSGLLALGRTPHAGRDRIDDGRTVEGPPSLLGTACLAAGLPYDPERLPRLDRAIGGEVPAVTPRMLLIERELWRRLGGFDERMPTADLSVRARALGARPVLVPDAQMAAIAPDRPAGRHSALDPERPGPRLVSTALLTERMAFAHRHLAPARARAAGLILSAAALVRSATGEPWLSIWRRRDSWLSAAEPMPFVPIQDRPPSSLLRRDLSRPDR